MKNCTYCKTEIHSEARRCPHCQTFQKWWYGFKPVLPLILMMFPFVLFMSKDLMKQLSPADFEDLKEKVTVIKISEKIVEERRGLSELKIILKLTNHTNINWERPNFEVMIKNKAGDVIDIQNKKDFNAKIAANGIKYVSLKIPASGKIEDYQTEVKLTEMKRD